jgi:hypothetical protein
MIYSDAWFYFRFVDFKLETKLHMSWKVVIQFHIIIVTR